MFIDEPSSFIISGHGFAMSAPDAAGIAPLVTAPAAPAAPAPPAAAAPPAAHAAAMATVTAAGGGGGGGAASRTSAIPTVADGKIDARLGVGQTTYRQVVVSGGAAGASYDVPAGGVQNGLGVEIFAVRDYRKGAHATQVLVPVRGRLTLGPGEQARVLVRVTGAVQGNHVRDLGFARVSAQVTGRMVRPLPMLTWVNAANAQKRGASPGSVEGVLQHFGVASTGTAGAGQRTGGAPVERFYFSAAYEAANKAPVQEVARRILEQEQKLRQTNPGATLWVQVSDEQDTTAAAARQTASWIGQLRQMLHGGGSQARLFVATQARDHNLAYAAVVDGWATTQSTLGQHSRASAIQRIQAAARASGRTIEVMEYPGNAFFDGGTPSSAATSVASAGLDGASSWFLFAANNLDTLESGRGEEGRGDIGGLVAIDNGAVLPTLALAEAEYGSNLAGAARAIGAAAFQTPGAQQVRAAAAQLDAYRHGAVPNFTRWERELAAAV